VRVAVFKTATEVVAFLFQQAADRSDAAYPPKPGEHYKRRERLQTQGIFGCFDIERDYYFDPKKGQGHFPADAALGLEGGDTSALARLICLESADATGFEKAQEHLRETGGMDLSACQMQRVVQRVGPAAQAWQERPTRPKGFAHPRSRLHQRRLHHGAGGRLWPALAQGSSPPGQWHGRPDRGAH